MVRLYLIVEIEPEDEEPATEENAEELRQMALSWLEHEIAVTADDREWFVSLAEVELRPEVH